MADALRESNAVSRFSDAMTIAATLHANQRRKGTEIPYISHLMSVSALVMEFGGDEDQAIAGLLHDVLEDVGAEHEAVIAERFGPRVAGIVRACTDADVLPKPPWRARKESYLAHLETAEPDALLVSLADKVHNARAILLDVRTHGAAVYDRFKGGREGTLWYYAALSEAFSRLLPGPLADELARTVEALQKAG